MVILFMTLKLGQVWGKLQHSKAFFLMCLLGWSLTNKILPKLQPNKYLWCLIFFLFFNFFWRMRYMSPLMNMFVSLHFELSYTNASLQTMCCGNRHWITLWRTTSSMHDHTSTLNFYKSSKIIPITLDELWGPATYPFGN